mmetsp:Transcript_22169/g.46454  ORF Transcript_22169/g.46454 Transcript_22169/m.46454 type:complete len:348 (-) Transcript_22169:211-1254(-)
MQHPRAVAGIHSHTAFAQALEQVIHYPKQVGGHVVRPQLVPLRVAANFAEGELDARANEDLVLLHDRWLRREQKGVNQREPLHALGRRDKGLRLLHERRQNELALVRVAPLVLSHEGFGEVVGGQVNAPHRHDGPVLLCQRIHEDRVHVLGGPLAAAQAVAEEPRQGLHCGYLELVDNLLRVVALVVRLEVVEALAHHGHHTLQRGDVAPEDVLLNEACCQFEAHACHRGERCFLKGRPQCRKKLRLVLLHQLVAFVVGISLVTKLLHSDIQQVNSFRPELGHIARADLEARIDEVLQLQDQPVSLGAFVGRLDNVPVPVVFRNPFENRAKTFHHKQTSFEARSGGF